MIVQNLDGINYELQEPFDLSFISNYGKVFKVFDKQDSGCISFGVQDRGGKFFIKVAGAKPVRFSGKPEDAVKALKNASRVYEDLRHSNLVYYSNGTDIKDGYTAIFEWTEAECMGRQYNSRHKFFQLPVEDRIRIFEDILIFHKFVAKQGYVAIDFYDGSIMYDFERKRTIICDIDYYSKLPYINTMGRMYGSSRFMSPEEFEKGATIDEVTNVFNMGATAFALLGDSLERNLPKWNAEKELFEVAKKAVSKDRKERYQSLDELFIAWNYAKNA